MARRETRNVRFDSRHVRLKKGETEKCSGGYEYRWTAPDGKRHSVYAPTLEKLRELEEQIAADKRDGIKADIRSLTVNDCFKLWRELKTCTPRIRVTIRRRAVPYLRATSRFPCPLTSGLTTVREALPPWRSAVSCTWRVIPMPPTCTPWYRRRTPAVRRSLFPR